MLEILILSFFVILLTYFYMVRYKNYLTWHKLDNNEAFISDFNHVYTPIGRRNKESIDISHEMKENQIIEIINYGNDESYIDVFDENKRRIYHFFCPKYLLFSEKYQGTHYLESKKKYSFFLTSISENNLMTFRQAIPTKIKRPPYLSKECDLIYYQEKNNIYLDNILKELKENNYKIKKIIKIEGINIWPHGGTVFKKTVTLNMFEKVLIAGTVKDSIQSLEILTEEDKYFVPIKGNKIFTHWIHNENFESLEVTIIERNINLQCDSNTDLNLIYVS